MGLSLLLDQALIGSSSCCSATEQPSTHVSISQKARLNAKIAAGPLSLSRDNEPVDTSAKWSKATATLDHHRRFYMSSVVELTLRGEDPHHPAQFA